MIRADGFSAAHAAEAWRPVSFRLPLHAPPKKPKRLLVGIILAAVVVFLFVRLEAFAPKLELVRVFFIRIGREALALGLDQILREQAHR